MAQVALENSELDIVGVTVRDAVVIGSWNQLKQKERTTMLKPRYHLYNSAVLNAPIATAWREMRDLVHMIDSIMVANDQVYELRWLDGGSAEQIPAWMQFVELPRGRSITQEVLGRCERTHTLTYRVAENAVGIEDHCATYTLKPITEEPDKTFWEWTIEFTIADGVDDKQFLSYFTDLVKDNIVKIKAYFARSTATSAPCDART
jgi:hypothetical protein